MYYVFIILANLLYFKLLNLSQIIITCLKTVHLVNFVKMNNIKKCIGFEKYL